MLATLAETIGGGDQLVGDARLRLRVSGIGHDPKIGLGPGAV